MPFVAWAWRAGGAEPRETIHCVGMEASRRTRSMGPRCVCLPMDDSMPPLLYPQLASRGA